MQRDFADCTSKIPCREFPPETERGRDFTRTLRTLLSKKAEQLNVDEDPASRRTIKRILAEMKKRCVSGEYDSQPAAELSFRKLVENEHAC